MVSVIHCRIYRSTDPRQHLSSVSASRFLSGWISQAEQRSFGIRRSLATGDWLPEIGYRRLATEDWLLKIGYWILANEHEDAFNRRAIAGESIADVGCEAEILAYHLVEYPRQCRSALPLVVGHPSSDADQIN